MIRLRGKAGIDDKSNKIIFTPRSGFVRGKGKAPELEFPLVYGHKCPYCSNVIQALFKAPKTFSLWPYEETVLLSQGEKNAGEVRKVFPDDKTKSGKSCYKIDFSPAEGGSIKIILRNHLMRHQALAERTFDGEKFWEQSYERPCTRAGLFSIREDLLVKDWLTFSQMREDEVNKCQTPPIANLILENDSTFKLVPAVGKAPPVILIERQNLLYGYYYQTRPLMTAYQKGK